jgi:2,5-diamino-6-(ribosylamino)-4(3H)-pyrimidinone 5'-phosphate reductase
VARPYVLINVAMTVDGKIDTVERRGAPISSEADRLRVDRLRAEADAVMVGGRTLLDEDPRLVVRTPELQAERVARGQPPNPAKVGVVSRPSLSPDSRFLTYGPARIVLFVAETAPLAELDGLRARDVEVFAHGQPRVDLIAAMDTLWQLGLRRVLVEGGASLNFELLRLGLVDELQIFLAPLIFGGASAPTLAAGAGLARAAAIPLQRRDVHAYDDGALLLRYAPG